MNQTSLEKEQANEALCRAIFAAASAAPEQLEAAAEAPFLYQRIRNELAASTAAAPRASRQNPLAFIFTWRWGWAAVALLVLAFGWWRLVPRRSVPSPAPINLAQTVAPSPAPRLPGLVKSEALPARATALPLKASLRAARAPKVRSPRPRPEEVLTAFMPLTYTADSAPTSGHLIRIEVTPSMLAALGFSVTPEREQKWLKADVVIGDDGLARAIRFVQ